MNENLWELFQISVYNYFESRIASMHKKHKAYLIFSIVFWLLILAGLILFGLSLGKVGINKYGLLRNYYSSWIDTRVYISGLYHKGIGYYFIQFPSSKVYLNDIKLNVTNKDMNVMQLTYSLSYRIIKDQTYNLYQQLSTNYESSIIATINSIISSYFIDKTQEQSRVTLQSQIVTKINSNYGSKMAILSTATQIQAFWLNQIDFLGRQDQYQSAYLQTGAISEAFTTMDIQMMKTNMQVQTTLSLIQNLKDQIVINSKSAYRNASSAIENSADYIKAQQKLILSNRSQAAQIFQYYSRPNIQFN